MYCKYKQIVWYICQEDKAFNVLESFYLFNLKFNYA